jgi:aryl-alcohol dehydrogenase-like predicted oxidoreductase
VDYRYLADTGIRISSLSLGTMTFAGSGSAFFEGVGGADIDEARRMVDLALDAGINFVDTADVYSRGLSESYLGEVLRGRRDRVLIATKCHGRMSDEVNDLGLSRLHIVKGCEDSLRRLDTDTIDLYQIHGFDAYTSWDESLSALDQLVQQGKVRYVGCSNLAAWQCVRSLSTSEHRSLSRFVAYQGNYSLVAREAEDELLPMCQAERLGFLVWSPLAGGYLTGKYRRSETGRRDSVGDPGNIDPSQGERVLDAVEQIAKLREVPANQVAINWVASRAGVTSMILGARTVEQLSSNLGSKDWSLTTDEIHHLDDASQRTLPYPHWHQRLHNARRFQRGSDEWPQP